jgi:molecular chaperone DnaJ
MQTTSVCPQCNGTGKSVSNRPKGSNEQGLIQEDVETTIHIPAGVSEGMQLSVSGKGNSAQGGGISGDLLIQIEEVPHENLYHEGQNVMYNLFISVPEAILGCSAEVPTIDGKARITIDPGTQSGKILKLRGKGLPDINSYHTGDQLIRVNVWIPSKISAEEEKAIRDLSGSENFSPEKRSKSEKSFYDRMKDFF